MSVEAYKKRMNLTNAKKIKASVLKKGIARLLKLETNGFQQRIEKRVRESYDVWMQALERNLLSSVKSLFIEKWKERLPDKPFRKHLRHAFLAEWVQILPPQSGFTMYRGHAVQKQKYPVYDHRFAENKRPAPMVISKKTHNDGWMRVKFLKASEDLTFTENVTEEAEKELKTLIDKWATTTTPYMRPRGPLPRSV